ncbi:MAG: hypothetical protein Q9195_008503 [Heterodermia aff. obscurata]
MQGLIVLGNPWVLSKDPCWLAFLKFCWRNHLWEEDKRAKDPRMPDGDEGDVNKWKPPSSQVYNENGEQVEPEDDIGALEASLIKKERKTLRLEQGENPLFEPFVRDVDAVFCKHYHHVVNHGIE